MDPQLQQTQQAYIYVGDDPVNGIDPEGTSGSGSHGYAQCGDPDIVGYNVWRICERENKAGIVGHGRDLFSWVKSVSRSVNLATADAYSGNTLVDEIPEGSQLVISEKAGDWYAFYWPVDNAKRRLWIHQASLGSQTFVAHNDLNPFLGTWNSKWGNVTERGIRIEEVNGRPKVTMDGWRVWDEKLENGVLSYRKKGGASNWEFVYTLTSKANKIELEVFRVHDQARFSGELSK